jgi:beta-glucosidase
MAADAQIEALVGELTVAEKCALVTGADVWSIPGCDRLGIPTWRVSDGPVGVRGQRATPGLLLPGPSAMAATWDTALVQEMGRALAQECLDRDVDLLLAPTVNLHRSPRAGRHFEMFSEDPELTAKIARAYIEGVQSEGVGACIKHFVGNEQEHERLTSESCIDEQTLREAYLRPFEVAVKDAHVRAVMGAYNYVNGDHACSHQHLLQEVLKGEWRFDGLVMSDWEALKETVRPARNGCDVEMPGPGKWWGDGQLAAAVHAGEVPTAQLDDKVRRILGLLSWRGRLPGKSIPAEERSVDRPEHRALARRAAAESMVLIKNAGLLPLRPGCSVALIGPGCAATALMGGGSAALTPHRTPSILESFTARWDGKVSHAVGVSLQRGGPSIPRAWFDGDTVLAELFDGVDFGGVPLAVQRLRKVANWWYGETYPEGVECLSVRLSWRITAPASGRYKLSGAGHGPTRLFLDGQLISDNEVDGFPSGLGLRGGEGYANLEAGRSYDLLLEARGHPSVIKAALTDIGAQFLDQSQDQVFAEAEQIAAACEVAVVVVGSNDQWESEEYDRSSIDLPADQDSLVRRVLAANPRTVVVLNCGAPMRLPWLDEVPAAMLAWYPGQEGPDAVVDVLCGQADPGGRMPTTWPVDEQDTPSYLNYPGDNGVVRYAEGLLLGHRWYEHRGLRPRIPFGHGLSYTTFDWTEAQISGSGTGARVSVRVRNSGKRAGAEVVQIYVAKDSPLPRPPKRLAGFAKLHLGPGEQATAIVDLDDSAFRRWDVALGAWTVDSGCYEIIVGASAIDERIRMHHQVAI